MRPCLAHRALVTLAISVLISAGAGAARGQVIGDTGSPRESAGRKNLSGEVNTPRVGRPKRPEPRYAAKTAVRTVTVTRIIRVTPTTGTLAVVAEPLAVVLIELIGGGKAQEGTIPANGRQFIFNYLPPGRYRVAAELDGYQPAEVEAVIKANKTEGATLNLEPITYPVTFKTNVEAGEIRYQNKTTGEPSRVKLIQNGVVVLDNLRAGKYDIDIRPADVAYQAFPATITLPGKTTFDVVLERLPSTALFQEYWNNLDRWYAPPGWSVASGKLLVNGRGVALPREENLRHYIDFQLTANVKMLNGVGAAFAIRAIDQQNYYLIQLTGASSDEPYVLRGYVVKKGVLQRLQAPISIKTFASTINANQFMTILVTVQDNKFDVKIRDIETNELVALGAVTDPDKNFLIGAVGIVSRNDERNEIWRFIICTQCPKE